MDAATERSRSLRAAIATHRAELVRVLDHYRAANPFIFGSVARGDAGSESDVDVLVELQPGGGNDLLRLAGIGEEFSRILGTQVDVVSEALLRDEVSATVRRDAVPL